ncbi:polysaccharide lyase 8 family protein [Nonomuraea sp. NN258]|uniref:polysaccharide lyase family 8 super-sandwich domain-containing protein n=1 Tax=Nonomuraea antri TaxID=2730852 RepID=UPI001568D575|nr:polysaccharide lyase family 8 super-sandwich domain-containing protein [Nonomuraea antri]NRQ39665.1 polysaccharide lyase 8 family protein [Nonomuraea antri]
MARRSLLLSLVTACAITLVAPPAVAEPPPTPAAEAADAFAVPLQLWRELATGGAGTADPAFADALARLDATADANLATLAQGRWPDLNGADGNTMSAIGVRLRSIALAYATAGSRRHGDAATAAAVVEGLRWTYDNRYRPGKPELGNWYGWEIGGPSNLLDTLMLLGDAAPAQLRADLLGAVAHFVPDPARRKVSGVPEVGANLVDKVSITVRRGLLARDAAVIALGRDKLTPVFATTVSGDGWYPDGSLIQHFYFAYTGGYGNALLGGVALVFALLADTPWRISDPAAVRWIFDGFEPVMFRGQMFANVRGRRIAVHDDTDRSVSRAVLTSMTILAEAAAPADRQRIAALVAEHTRTAHFAQHATVTQLALVKRLTTGVTPRGDLTLTKVFAGMDRFVHHRPGYAFTVAARSNRVGAYEAGNGENLKGWYTGDGMTMIYGDYGDGYWPTVDPYRLPGVTNATEQSYPRTARDTNWYGYRQSDPHTGGVALGDLAAFGMRLQAETDYHSKRPIDLTARKSWFTVGDTIVALGADITASNVAAQTTVENRMNPGRVTVDGGRWADLSGARWMHVEGVGGYLFPQGGALRAARESRTGKWTDISPSNPAELTRDYATVWFDHGQNPAQAGYAYYLLPGKSAEQTAAAAARPGVRVGDNTAQVQSVIAENGVNTRLAATFWSCATTQGTVRAYGPAAVTMKQEGTTLDLAVSDPTWRQGRMLFEVAREGREVLAADPRVTVLSTAPTIRFTVDSAGALGAGVTLKVKVKPTARPTLTGQDCAGAKHQATADAYVRGGTYATRSFDGQGLVVKQVPADASYTRQSFLRFDRPAGPVALARLWLNGAIADADGDTTTLTLYEVPDQTWDESTLTWNTKPPLGQVIGTVTVTGKTPAWYSVDLTAHLRAGGGTSFALFNGTKTLAVQFHDRENPANGPYLQVY